MKLSHIVSASLLLISSMSAKAQLVLYKSVIAGGGTSYTSAGLSADWTVGQPVVNQYTSSGLTVTEGFHPTYIATQQATDVTTIKSNIRSVNAYPNPTNAILHIAMEQEVAKPVLIQLMDVTGRMIKSQTESAQLYINTEIDLSAVSPGTYVILLNANTADAYTMKVVKQ